MSEMLPPDVPTNGTLAVFDVHGRAFQYVDLNHYGVLNAAEIKRALTFWGRVVPILGAYKAVELSADLPAPVRLAVGLTGLELPSSEEETEKAYEELHEWGSVRLEDTIHLGDVAAVRSISHTA